MPFILAFHAENIAFQYVSLFLFKLIFFVPDIADIYKKITKQNKLICLSTNHVLIITLFNIGGRFK